MMTSEVGSRPTQPASGLGDGGSMPWLRARWVVPGALASLGVVLFFAYLVEASKLPIFADGSSQALQAWDMLHGNPLLHGWVLSDVSFYTTEIPQYMLIELFRGLNPDVEHIAAAMTYALLVVLAAVLAKGKATGREGLVRVLIPVGIMLAPSLGRILFSRAYSTAWILLSAPDHTGTQVPLVLIWLVLDRLKPRWWLPILVAALLTWVQIADPTAIYEGALPIVIVGAARMYRRRGPLAGQWYDLSLAIGALASVAFATEALKVIKSAGGFAVNPAAPVLVSVSGMTTDFWLKVQAILSVFGADFFSMQLTQAITPIVHLVAFALAAWGVMRALRRFFADDDLAIQVVAISFLVLLAAFLFGFRTGGREVVGLLPMGAVLAGRMLPGRVFQLKLVPALAVVLAFYVLSFGYHLIASPLPNPDRALASWLRAHHLTYGLSTTWYASNGISLISRDHVRVRDVKIDAGEISRLTWNTKASWYDPHMNDARFVIFNPCAPTSLTQLVQTVGQPTTTYFVDGFTVVVWDTNLLAGHTTVASPRSPGRHSKHGRLAGPPPPDLTRIGNRYTSSYEVMCG